MLVLLSFFLVLVATVLLVIGLLDDGGLGLIYISIACSAIAALVLVIAVRMARPKDERGASAPEPLAPEPVPAGVGAATVASGPPTVASGATEGDEWLAGDQDEWEEDTTETWTEEDEEVDFPIAEYDSLTVAQVMPLLPRLYTDELDVVEAREREGKSRASILAKIDELRGAGGADEAEEEVAATDDAWDDDDFFPIEDYDALSVGQIRPLLGELEPDELEVVRQREANGAARASILDDIKRRLPKKAAPSKRAPAKKAAKKVAPTPIKRAAPARKAVPSKKAAPARKATPAKRPAPAKKAATKKAAPAKKAAKKAAKKR